MKYIWKKAAASLLAATLLTGGIPMQFGNSSVTDRELVAYANNITEGYCGAEGRETSLTWKLDDRGILTISGDGMMQDYKGTGIRRGWESYADAITEIVIEEGVRSIGSSAFFGFSNLNSVTIPDSMAKIGDGAFSSSGLTSFIIPEIAMDLRLGDGVFFDCKNLDTFVIESKYPVKLGNEVFYGTSRNLIIYVPREMDDWYRREWSAYERIIQISTLKEWPCGNNSYSCIAEFTAGGTLTIRGNDSIADYQPMSAPWYKDYASEIKKVVIEEDVTGIGDHTFDGCTALTSVRISDTVSRIGNGAFYGCSALTSVTVPDSVTSIGEGAFAFCENMTELNVDEDNQYFCTEDGVLFSKDQTRLCIYPAKKTEHIYSIPETVTSIDDAAFACSSLITVTVPESVERIGASAFAECDDLTSVAVQRTGTLTALGADAFSGTPVGESSRMDALIYTSAAETDDYKQAESWNDYADKISSYELADNQYKQKAYRDCMYYTRFVFVVPKSEFAGKSKATFTAAFDGREFTYDTYQYYTGVTSNGVTFVPASGNSAMFVVTVSSSADISADLTCKLEFE